MIRRPRLLAAAIALALATGPRIGAAEDELQKIIDGFDPPEPAPAATPQPAAQGAERPPGKQAIQIDGALSLAASYNHAARAPAPGQTDHRGLSRMRGELKLAVGAPLPRSVRVHVSGHAFRDLAYMLQGRDEFTPQVLDQYESEVELDEAWVEATPLPNLDVKLGRQIAAVGPADLLRVVDVLNPVDNREPGLVDLEDLRLPLAMTRLDYFQGPIRATAIAVHESRLDKQPVFGSDFYPPGIGPLAHRRPANGGSDTEYAFMLAGSFAGVDAALYHTRYFERRAHLARDFALENPRLQLSGASAAFVSGAWGFKGELARVSGLELFRSPERFSRTDALLGFEYSGFAETQISVELALRHLAAFDDALELAPDSLERNAYEIAARYRRFLWNNRLRFVLMASAFGAHLENGAGLRASLSYAPTDAMTLELGALWFRGGKRPPFTYINDGDRIFMKAQYSF